MNPERNSTGPNSTAAGPAGPVPRRAVLKGATVIAGAALGLGTAPTAARADDRADDGADAADASINAVSPGGITAIGLALVGGALRWSARRRGAKVVDVSGLGLKLADGTVLGAAGTVL